MKLICLAIKNNFDKRNYYFEKSCKKYNIDYRIINIFNKKYKYEQLLKYIEYLDDNCVLLVVEYSSTLIVNNENDIVNAFKNLKVPYIFSQENEIKNIFSYSKRYYKLDNNFCFDNGQLSFPNIEYFIGFKDDLLDIISKINDYKFIPNEDQNNILNNMCHLGYRINVDNNNTFFFNSNNNNIFNENIKNKNNNILIRNTLLTNFINYSQNKKTDEEFKPFVLCNFSDNDTKMIWDSINDSKYLEITSNDKYTIYFSIFMIILILLVYIFNLNKLKF